MLMRLVVLLVITASSTRAVGLPGFLGGGSSSDKTDNPEDKSASSRFSQIYSAASSAVSTVASGINVFRDDTDDKRIANLYKPVLDGIKEKLNGESCLRGLSLDLKEKSKKLVLNRGRMTGLERLSLTAKVLKKDADTVDASVTFNLPDVPITFNFRYDTIRLIPLTRRGQVEVQAGQVGVQFRVQVPRSLKALDAMVQAKKPCIVRILEGPSVVTTDEVQTKSVRYVSIANMMHLGVTGPRVKKLVTGLQTDLEENLKAALPLLVEPEFRASDVNCVDAAYVIPVTAADKEALDCDSVREASQFDSTWG